MHFMIKSPYHETIFLPLFPPLRNANAILGAHARGPRRSSALTRPAGRSLCGLPGRGGCFPPLFANPANRRETRTGAPKLPRSRPTRRDWESVAGCGRLSRHTDGMRVGARVPGGTGGVTVKSRVELISPFRSLSRGYVREAGGAGLWELWVLPLQLSCTLLKLFQHLRNSAIRTPFPIQSPLGFRGTPPPPVSAQANARGAGQAWPLWGHRSCCPPICPLQTPAGSADGSLFKDRRPYAAASRETGVFILSVSSGDSARVSLQTLLQN